MRVRMRPGRRERTKSHQKVEAQNGRRQNKRERNHGTDQGTANAGARGKPPGERERHNEKKSGRAEGEPHRQKECFGVHAG